MAKEIWIDQFLHDQKAGRARTDQMEKERLSKNWSSISEKEEDEAEEEDLVLLNQHGVKHKLINSRIAVELKT